MAKEEILEQIREARGALLAAIEDLPPDTLLRSHVVGYWSIKDVLAHLTAWEAELITALSQLDNPTHIPGIVEIEDGEGWNEEQYHISARRPLELVLEDFHGVHKHLLKAVEALDERTLTDARLFTWMEGEPLSYLIAESATWHEEEHAEQIRRWREENNL